MPQPDSSQLYASTLDPDSRFLICKPQPLILTPMLLLVLIPDVDSDPYLHDDSTIHAEPGPDVHTDSDP